MKMILKLFPLAFLWFTGICMGLIIMSAGNMFGGLFVSLMTGVFTGMITVDLWDVYKD